MCGAFIPVDGVVLSDFCVEVSFVAAGLDNSGDEDVEVGVGQPVRSRGQAARRRGTSQRRPQIVCNIGRHSQMNFV
jgi:hypothetical protein